MYSNTFTVIRYICSDTTFGWANVFDHGCEWRATNLVIWSEPFFLRGTVNKCILYVNMHSSDNA